MSKNGEAGLIEARYRLNRDEFVLDVDLTLATRGITGLFGRSGAGKTSLLRCIAGLDRPDEGRLVVDGEVWQDSSNRVGRAVHEREIGYVFQEPRLFPHLDVRGNLDYGQRRTASGPHQDFDDVVTMLALEPLLDRQVAGLSGGEAQRVAIGRALLRSPRLMLMDEPLAALDEDRKNELLPYLDRLHNTLDIPALYVSHNIGEIAMLCDQLVVLDAGKAVAQGDLQSVLMQTELPIIGGDEAGTVLDVTCTAFDESFGLTRASVSGGEIWVPGRHKVGEKLRIRIRANDVSIALAPPARSSILNALAGEVRSVEESSGSSALVHLNCGSDRLLARVTRKSVHELGLGPGMSVVLQIKSVSVRAA